MSCDEARHLLHVDLDGELDLVKTLEMEEHREACQICAREFQEQQALQTALRTSSLNYAAPLRLGKRLQSAVRIADSSRAATPASASTALFARSWLMAAAAAILTGLVILGYLRTVPIVRPPIAPAVGTLIAQEVLDSHLRSLMPGHLEDVVSTDQHTVKPWFDGKLDFSPPVTDFAAQGFPLIGGRLDDVNGRSVAALIYRRRRHVINLFIWPASREDGVLTDTSVTPITRQGYHLEYWVQARMEYWAVSDVSNRDLTAFTHLVQAHGA